MRFNCRFNVPRGSPSNGSPFGMKISQNTRARFESAADHGNTAYVSGSISKRMSLS